MLPVENHLKRSLQGLGDRREGSPCQAEPLRHRHSAGAPGAARVRGRPRPLGISCRVSSLVVVGEGGLSRSRPG